MTFNDNATKHMYVHHCNVKIVALCLCETHTFYGIHVKNLKKSPRTPSIEQIIFSFWSFEISEGSLRNQKIIFGLDSFSNQRLIYLAPFGLY